jgi:hypothetical protein
MVNPRDYIALQELMRKKAAELARLEPVLRSQALAVESLSRSGALEFAARRAAEFRRFQDEYLAPLMASQSAVELGIARLVSFDRDLRVAIGRIDDIALQATTSWRAIQRQIVNAGDLRALFDRLDARQRQAAVILAKKGWWLSPDFPIRLLNVVVEMKENGQGRQINRLICDYYNPRRLSSLASKWMEDPIFKRRQRPIGEALGAHKQRKWLLSIPVLLAQMEGVLRDYAEQRNMSRKKSVKKLAALLRAKSPDASLVGDTWIVQLEGIFASGYKTTENKVAGLRRNAILHGLEVHYGSELRSLQLFLQLDTIHWLLSAKQSTAAA